MEDLVSNIKTIRVEIDSLINNAGANNKGAWTYEALKSLMMGKSWLGRALGALNEANPYPASETASGIPPTADTSETFVLAPADADGYTRYLNLQRKDIQDVVDNLEMLDAKMSAAIYVELSIQHLTEAKFWYGFELAEIREKALG